MENFLFMKERAEILATVSKLDNKPHQGQMPVGIKHIMEFGRQKFSKVIPGSLKNHYNKGIEICYINRGKYQWQVEEEFYTLYPGDCFVTCPFEKHGGIKGYLDIGMLTWIVIEPEKFNNDDPLILGKWTNLSSSEQEKMGNLLKNKSSHKFSNDEIGKIMENIYHEISGPKDFHISKTKSLTELLLIETCRSLEVIKTRNKQSVDLIVKLDLYIHAQLCKTITLEGLSRELGISCTALNEKIKTATGYSPMNYVTSIRLELAKKQLNDTRKTITSIAHDCGFYSSQYFADTFKKWNGISPGKFRKNNLAS